MKDNFERYLSRRLSQVSAPAYLVPRTLQTVRQKQGTATTARAASHFKQLAATLAALSLLTVILLGALGEFGPTMSYAVASVDVVSAQIHLPTFARLSQGEASNRAIQWLSSQPAKVSGYRLSSAYHADALTKVVDPTGYDTYTTSFPENDYVFWYSAPAQGGYRNVTALVVVNAWTGAIESSQIREVN
ncbi:MAG: hypothetical protein QOH92_175 [Chloroflexota bacterium]|jgi:hypothetical protein|nr:hypothetical protein [Chloroflexota bacterium]